MEKLKFGNRAEDVGVKWDYYGVSQAEWYALTPTQRTAQFNRTVNSEIQAPLTLPKIQSYDPYFYSSHMRPHRPVNECDCQTCVQKIGIERTRL